MKFSKAFPGIVGLLLLAVTPAVVEAQGTTVRGQIFLPGGDMPNHPIRFYLTRNDGALNDYRFTDSNGRFILERLRGDIEHTITIESDGRTFGRTTQTFMPQYEATVRIYLNPLPARPIAKQDTISVNTGYRPSAEAEAAHKEAVQKIQEDKFDEAEKLLLKAVAADAKFPEAKITLGALYVQLRKWPDAEKYLREGLALDPKSAYGQMMLGVTMNRQNRFAEAIAPLREALRLSRDLATAHLHLGVALYETDQFEEAERELMLAESVTGTEAALYHLYLGQLFARTNRYEKAIPEFEKYLQLLPNAKNAPDVRALIQRMKQELASRK
jgi:tetratricopeptide (TPR) repeat protein